MTEIEYEFDGTRKTIEYTAGAAGKPLVLLLHGAGGTRQDMTAIDQRPYPHYDYKAAFPPDRDVGWRVYPGFGVWSFTLDGEIDHLVSWRQVLTANGFSTATYTQVDSTGLLRRAVDELVAVIATLRQPPPEIEEPGLPAQELVILAHSRGGLLTRKFLKDHADLVANLTKVITIHSPHQGSDVASIAQAFADAIAAVPGSVRPLVEQALGEFTRMVQQPAWQELRVGSPFLKALADGESALPHMQYFTFGGINVEVTRVSSWVYTVGSALPQWHWPPFHHVITLAEVPVVSPVCNSLPPIVDEITHGKGDLLTADARCRLPFAVHQSNALNHAECLWDPGLHAQVLAILGEEGGFWE